MPIDIGTALVGAGQDIAQGILSNEERKRRARLDAEQLALRREEIETAKGNAQRLLEESKASIARDQDKQSMAMLDAYGGQRVSEQALAGISPQLRALTTQSAGRDFGMTSATPSPEMPGRAIGNPTMSPEMFQIRESEPARMRQAIQQANIRAATAGTQETGRDRRFDAGQVTTRDLADFRNETSLKIAEMGANARMATATPVIIMTPDGRRLAMPWNAVGQEPGVKPEAASSTSAAAADANEVTLRNLDIIKQSNPQKYVGSLAQGFKGKRSKFSTWSGYGLTPELAQLSGAVAAYNNNIIHLLSGAAVSLPEENRLRRELLDLDQPPETFKANFDRARDNTEFLLTRQKNRMGGAQRPGSAGGVKITSIQEIK